MNTGSNEYLFKGRKLDVPAARMLIREYLPKLQWYKRFEIINFVDEKHLELGGVEPEQATSQIIRGALKTELRRGNAEHGEQGYYRFKTSPGHCIRLTEDHSLGQPLRLRGSNKRRWLTIERTVGAGQQCVYLHFYEIFRKDALAEGREVYLHKLGYTEQRNPIDRIFGQGVTYMPSNPIVALRILTHDGFGLESALKALLIEKGCYYPSGGGTEFYMTSAKMIEDLWRIHCPSFSGVADDR